MKRRGFLQLAALAGLPACANRRAGGGTPKKVIVVGAGLAGLVAAHELTERRYAVTVLEARSSPGGRVHTLREPFSDGLRAEAGALFVPSNHDLTLKYARLAKLAMEPAMPLFAARMFYVRGRHIVANRGDAGWPFDLTPEERKLGYAGIWEKYLNAPLRELGAIKTAGDGSGDGRLVALDRMSAAEFLQSRGASAGAIALLRVGYLDMLGDGIESYSALQLLQRIAPRQTAGPPTVTYCIRGGSDLLPQALAASLGESVRYQSPVVRIEPAATSASVVVVRDGERQRLAADYVVCTLPFTVLKGIDVSPSFSPQKARAIEELRSTSVVRVFLQFRRRAWTADDLYVLTTTDLPMKWVFDHTVNQRGARGILEAQALGEDARRVARMPEADRIEFALSQLEQIFPGIRTEYERGTSISWDDAPWARGAFAYFRPGQMLSMLPHVVRPEGRVHFAGDHTSAWSGWMQGAIESGLRAAREIREAA
jgi:monoamine oxidase